MSERIPAIGVSKGSVEITYQRIHLPLRNGGLGRKELGRVVYAAQTIWTLLESKQRPSKPGDGPKDQDVWTVES